MAMPETMRYISLFSGIEAASAAWSQLGWKPLAFSEVEPFCCDLLHLRFPDVPNLGDVSTVDWTKYEGAADVVIGGSPCQAFSVAGKRGGMLDERGLLMLEYVRAVREVRPRWVVWENVPGVLSQDGGRAFASILEELENCGYSLAWRVLDAQFWGVAQRRRRVYLVGHPIAGCAAAVLFEPGILRGSDQASRGKRAELAARAGFGVEKHCYGVLGNVCDRRSTQNGSGVSAEIAPTLNTVDRHLVAGCLTPWDGQSRRVYETGCAAPALAAQDRDGGNNSLNVLAFDTTQVTDPRNGNNPHFGDPCHTISATAHVPSIAFSAGNSVKAGSVGAQEEVAPTLRSSASGTNQVPTICFNHSASGSRGFGESVELSPTLRSSPGNCSNMPSVCMASGQANAETMDECSPTLTRRSCKDSPVVTNGYCVRRLTPVECERLQGFPDNWTAIPWRGKPAEECPDTPRYKALGNSMAVPVVKWVGERISMVEKVMGL